MDNFIEYINISKSYNSNIVIDNFNLKVKEGEFLTILGTSGSGKTTILKMVNALIEPNNGVVKINNEDIKTKDIINLRRSIGYAIQGSILFPHINVFDNICYVLNLLKYSKEDINNRVIELLNLVWLDESFISIFPNELSGGQQQRVSVARSLAANPKIILMDEPFGAVDCITRIHLQKMIKEIHTKTNVTILFITHDINEAFTLGTKVLIMDKGKIEQYDTVLNIKNNPKTEFVKLLID